MPTSTTNFSFQKPLVNDPTDEDLWGGYLNDDLDDIDTELFSAQSWAKTATLAKSAAYTITTSDRNKTILCDASGAVFTVTLESAATCGDGFRITIKKIDSSANAVTVDGNGAETLEDAATYSLSTQYDFVTLQSNGTEWFVIAKNTTLSFASAATTLTGTSTTEALTPGGFAGNKSLGANGYYKFPGGMIEQWGKYAGGANSGTITFPTAFASACYSVVATANNAGGSNGVIINLSGTPGTTSFTFDQRRHDGASPTGEFYWRAIGV